MPRRTHWSGQAECFSDSTRPWLDRPRPPRRCPASALPSAPPSPCTPSTASGSRYSTAYLAKPVCREMHCAGWLDATDGSPILTSLALVKSWGNPYQRDQFDADAALGDFHRPTRRQPSPGPAGRHDPLARLPRVLAADRSALGHDAARGNGRADERPGRAAAQRLGRARPLRRCQPGRFQGRPADSLDVRPRQLRGNTAAMRIADDADVFLRPVRFELIDDKGRVRDCVESAVVPWRPEKLQAGPKLAVSGRYLDYRCGGLAAPASFLVGANWQDRVQYGFTWHNPNGLRVAGDALKMAAAGMRIVRPHYMLPGWMRTTPWQIYSPALPGVYDQFELGPEISERHCAPGSPRDDLQLAGDRLSADPLHPPPAANGRRRVLDGQRPAGQLPGAGR